MNDKTVNTIEKFEYQEIFQVKEDKTVERWGFFTQQPDGRYAICRPQNTSFVIGTYDFSGEFEMEPGEIKEDIAASEIQSFLDSLGTVYAIPLRKVTKNTPVGWYYDSIIYSQK